MSNESLTLFAVFLTVYLAVAMWLEHENVVFTDATSRLANAFFVLFSRYPHLPAMGFVWNPLPSVVLLPLLPFKSLLPALVTVNVAGAIQSAVCMSGTVAALASCLRKMGLGQIPRVVLVVVFGIQPMILLYGGNGDSESMMLLFLALAASSTISWVQERQPGSLIAAGVALGLDYLARYEAVAPAIAVTGLVLVISFVAADGRTKARIRVAVNDMMLVGAPALFAVVLWAASAKLLVGLWFPTFSSTYGNAAQVANSAAEIQRETGLSIGQMSTYLGRQMFVLAPFCAVLLVVAMVLAARRRDAVAMIAPAVFGSVMAFGALVFLLGSSFGWLRFQISIIPLCLLLAGSILAPQPPSVPQPLPDGGSIGVNPNPSPSPSPSPSRDRRAGSSMRVSLIALLLVGAMPTQWFALTQPSLELAREEAPALSAVFHPGRSAADDGLLTAFRVEKQVAADVGGMHLPPGSVLTDSAFAFGVIINSPEPRVFVIDSDLDFAATLRDPLARHVEYLLLRTDAPSDQLLQRWPSLATDGAGVAGMVRQWQGPLCHWRLFRLN